MVLQDVWPHGEIMAEAMAEHDPREQPFASMSRFELAEALGAINKECAINQDFAAADAAWCRLVVHFLARCTQDEREEIVGLINRFAGMFRQEEATAHDAGRGLRLQTGALFYQVAYRSPIGPPQQVN